MLSISRFSTSAGLGMDALGEALLNWGFLRSACGAARPRSCRTICAAIWACFPARAAVRPARSALVGHEAEGLVRGRRAVT